MPLDEADRQKLITAERRVAPLRNAVILLNSVVYLFFTDFGETLPSLAASVILVAGSYGLLVQLFEPYRRYDFLLSSHFTTLSDGILILVWVYATGGIASPFYLTWYASIVAVSFRYGWKPTLGASGVYAASYIALLFAMGQLPGNAGTMALRVGYMGLIATLTAMMAKESLEQTRAHFRMADVASLLDKEVHRRTVELEASERRLREALVEVQAANERLKEMDAFKTRFINTAAHELNTPITPIKLQLHLLKSGKLGDFTEKQKKSVTVLDRNVERLKLLVTDVLDVARLQSGHLRVNCEEQDLRDLLSETVDSFEEPMRRAGVRFVLRIADGEELRVHADAHRLMQVLYNLLNNALKFTPRDGTIVLEAASAGDAVRVRVSDSGAGMTEAQMAKLFQPFSQVHDTMETTRSGTGLGLYICKGIVDAHWDARPQGQERGAGRRIWVESAGPGEGSTFTFEVPAKPVASTVEQEPARRSAAKQPQDAIAKRARELI